MPKPKALWHMGKRAARFGTDKLRGYKRGTRLTMGKALAAARLKSALDAGVTLRKSAAVEGLLTEGRRIYGVRVSANGGTETHEARGGGVMARSEERRVGKEGVSKWRSRWETKH